MSMTGNERGYRAAHIFTFAQNPFLIQKELDVLPGDIVVAADCGLITAETLGFSPQLLAGDFDSLDRDRAPAGTEILQHSPEKDDTDTMLAVKAAFSRGFSHIEIAGGLGGRQDHALANLALLQYIHERGGSGLLSAERERVYLLPGGTRSFDFAPGDIFSVFAWGGDAFGVCVSGAKYPLCNTTLRTSQCLGVSNVASGAVEISVSGGYLMIFLNLS